MYSCYFSFSDVFLPPPPKKKDGVQGYNIAATCRNEVVYMYLSNIDAPSYVTYWLPLKEECYHLHLHIQLHSSGAYYVLLILLHLCPLPFGRPMLLPIK